MTRRVLGCMTGTSLDGIDVAAVEIDGHGLAMRAAVVAAGAAGFGGYARELRALSEGEAMTAGEIAALSHAYSLSIAEALASLDGGRADLACVHGQTVYHAPPLSWQLLTPGVVAEALGCPVVSDLRGADLASGGQGAPITPLADAVLYGCDRPRCVVNLGGFVNVTCLPGRPVERVDEIRGGDVCPCNRALDLVAEMAFGVAFDEGGERAMAGGVDAGLVGALTGLFGRSGDRRSLGTHDSWKPVLVSAMERGVDGRVIARSVAAAMAVLGALSVDGVPITLPRVTGCSVPAPLAGVLTVHGRGADR